MCYLLSVFFCLLSFFKTLFLNSFLFCMLCIFDLSKFILPVSSFVLSYIFFILFLHPEFFSIHSFFDLLPLFFIYSFPSLIIHHSSPIAFLYIIYSLSIKFHFHAVRIILHLRLSFIIFHSSPFLFFVLTEIVNRYFYSLSSILHLLILYFLSLILLYLILNSS